PVVAEAEVDAADVADAERLVDGARQDAQARGDVARDVGRAADLHLRRIDVLQAVVVDVVAAARRRIDDVLDGREDAVVLVRALDEPYGHVAAWDELLDEHAGRIGLEGAPEQRRQRLGIARDRLVADALRAAFVVRLDDDREREGDAALHDAAEL